MKWPGRQRADDRLWGRRCEFGTGPQERIIPAFVHAELSESIIRCVYEVRREMRPGLAEVLYRRALVLELEAQRLPVKTEVPYAVAYRGSVIGTYRADVVVDDRIIVEVKHVDRLVQAHRDQLHNYLRIAELRVGLLVNFGVRSEVRRVENWQFADSTPAARLEEREW